MKKRSIKQLAALFVSLLLVLALLPASAFATEELPPEAGGEEIVAVATTDESVPEAAGAKGAAESDPAHEAASPEAEEVSENAEAEGAQNEAEEAAEASSTGEASMAATVLGLLSSAEPIAPFAEVDYGTDGNISWSLDDAGVLSITGSGNMNNYSIDTMPWVSYLANITTVIIADGVSSVGNAAFYGCTNLSTVTLPSGITIIGGFAFYGCTSLASIDLPSNLTSIGNFAFQDCETLVSITLPNGVTSIGTYAFYGCTVLDNITVPNNITSIGKGTFESCSSLSSITLPSGLMSIDNSAFESCTSLASITIPSGVASINDYVFRGCESLVSITLPADLTSIGNSVFDGCESLTSITLPSGLTSIGNGTFSGCESLTSITLPSGLMSIGDSVFDGCESLDSITLPSDLTSIGNYAFRECTSLVSITVPSGVASIGNYAFGECTSLLSITVPSGVASIGNYAFGECSNLNSIVFKGTAPPASIAGTAFNSIASAGILYFPEGSEANYTDAWKSALGGNRLPTANWILVAYSTSPQLTAGTVERASATEASITFQSDEAGQYYYALVADGVAEPVVDTNGTGVVIAAVTDAVINLAGIPTTDAYDLWIYIKNAGGYVGSLQVDIPEYIAPPVVPVVYSVDSHFGTFDGSGTCTATIDAPHADFLYLEKDGVVVDPSHYTTQEGSTIITLTEAHMAAHDNGEHSYRAVFAGGHAELMLTVDVQSAVVPAPVPTPGPAVSAPVSAGKPLPLTGDNSLGWLVALGISALGLLLLTLGRRRFTRSS